MVGLDAKEDTRSCFLSLVLWKITSTVYEKKPWILIHAKDIAAELGFGLRFVERALEAICEGKKYMIPYPHAGYVTAVRYFKYEDTFAVRRLVDHPSVTESPNGIDVPTIAEKLRLDIDYVRAMVETLVKQGYIVNTIDTNHVKFHER
jgi:hypothetical protein